MSCLRSPDGPAREPGFTSGLPVLADRLRQVFSLPGSVWGMEFNWEKEMCENMAFSRGRI